jgi:hypothetical protein
VRHQGGGPPFSQMHTDTQGDMPLFCFNAGCGHKGAHVFLPPLLSFLDPACSCLCSMATSRVPWPAQWTGSSSLHRGRVKRPLRRDWSLVPSRQAQAGSAAVWSLWREIGFSQGWGHLPAALCTIPPDPAALCARHPPPTTLTFPGSGAASAAVSASLASAAARGP